MDKRRQAIKLTLTLVIFRSKTVQLWKYWNTHLHAASEIEGIHDRKNQNHICKRFSLFLDDLKVYQDIQKFMKVINENIVQASRDIRVCYEV